MDEYTYQDDVSVPSSWVEIDKELGFRSKAEERAVNATLSFEEKMQRVQENYLDKNLDLHNYVDAKPVSFPDADSAIIEVNGEQHRIRLSSNSHMFYDAVDSPETLASGKKSDLAYRKQLYSVAQLTGKGIGEVTAEDIQNVKNYQTQELYNSLANPNHKFTPYDKGTVYNAPDTSNLNFNLKVKVLGKDDHGRLIVDAVNPHTQRSLGFDLASNPYLNSRFDLFKSLDTDENRQKLSRYDAQHESLTETLQRYQEHSDTDGRFGEDIDIIQSSMYQSAARLLQHIPGADKEYWSKLANAETGQIWADLAAGVSPRTRREFQQGQLSVSKKIEEGDYVGATVEAFANIDRYLAESLPQTSLMIAGGIAVTAATGGTAAPMAILGSTPVRALLAALPAGLDKALTNAEEFKKENGRSMNPLEFANNLAWCTATLVPEQLLLGMFGGKASNLFKASVERVMGKASSSAATTSTKAIIGDAIKTVGIATGGEAAQEYSEEVSDTLISENQAKKKGFLEDLYRVGTSTEAKTAALIGGVLGGTLSAAGGTLATPINIRNNAKAREYLGKVAQVEKERTITGQSANTDTSNALIQEVNNVPTPNTQKGKIDTAVQLREKITDSPVSIEAANAAAEKANKLEVSALVEAIKKGESVGDIETALNKSKEEVFREAIYFSSYNTIRAFDHNQKVTSSEREEAKKDLIELGKQLGIDEREIFKFLEDVDHEISVGPSGYVTYAQGLQKAQAIIDDPNLSEEQKADAYVDRRGHLHSIVRLYANQLAKMEQLAEAAEELAGGKSRSNINWRTSEGTPAFYVLASDIANGNLRYPTGPYRVVDAIQRAVRGMRPILNSVDPELLSAEIEAFNKYNPTLAINNLDDIRTFLDRFKNASVNVRNRAKSEEAAKSKGKSSTPATDNTKLVNSIRAIAKANNQANNQVTKTRRYTSVNQQLKNTLQSATEERLNEIKQALKNSIKDQTELNNALTVVDNIVEEGKDDTAYKEELAKKREETLKKVDSILANTELDRYAVNSNQTVEQMGDTHKKAMAKYNSLAKLLTELKSVQDNSDTNKVNTLKDTLLKLQKQITDNRQILEQRANNDAKTDSKVDTKNIPADAITSFSNEYHFLSNFYSVGGLKLPNEPLAYKSVESAFQAAKAISMEARKPFTSMIPNTARQAGRKLKNIRKDWDKVKLGIMEDLLRQKFSRPELKKRLLATGNRELIEGNTWGDTFWGVDSKKGGENHLGKLLMKIRSELQEQDTSTSGSSKSAEAKKETPKTNESTDNQLVKFVESYLKTRTDDFKGKVVLDDKIVSLAAINYGTNTIHINPDVKLWHKKFNDKAWNNPREQKDGSKAKPLGIDFANIADFARFCIEHEIQHTLHKQKKGESKGDYETRINELTLAKMGYAKETSSDSQTKEVEEFLIKDFGRNSLSNEERLESLRESVKIAKNNLEFIKQAAFNTRYSSVKEMTVESGFTKLVERLWHTLYYSSLREFSGGFSQSYIEEVIKSKYYNKLVGEEAELAKQLKAIYDEVTTNPDFVTIVDVFHTNAKDSFIETGKAIRKAVNENLDPEKWSTFGRNAQFRLENFFLPDISKPITSSKAWKTLDSLLVQLEERAKAKSGTTASNQTSKKLSGKAKAIDKVMKELDVPFISLKKTKTLYTWLNKNISSLTAEQIATVQQSIDSLLDNLKHIGEYQKMSQKAQNEYRDELEMLSNSFDYALSNIPRAKPQSTTETKKDTEPTSTTKAKGYVLHSGGAEGSDTMWGKIGAEYGLGTTNHYYHGQKSKYNAPNGNVAISQEDYEEGRVEAAKAAKVMYNYQYKTMKDPRLIRNWSQVKYADAIFAIGNLITGGIKFSESGHNSKTDDRVAAVDQVAGGTGYAVTMATLHNKPVYVFNQREWKHKDGTVAYKANTWYYYDYQAGSFWEYGDIPALTKNFAGIGTSKQLSDAGIQAIRDVYEKTFNKPEPKSQESQQPSQPQTTPTKQEKYVPFEKSGALDSLFEGDNTVLIFGKRKPSEVLAERERKEEEEKLSKMTEEEREWYEEQQNMQEDDVSDHYSIGAALDYLHNIRQNSRLQNAIKYLEGSDTLTSDQINSLLEDLDFYRLDNDLRDGKNEEISTQILYDEYAYVRKALEKRLQDATASPQTTPSSQSDTANNKGKSANSSPVTSNPSPSTSENKSNTSNSENPQKPTSEVSPTPDEVPDMDAAEEELYLPDDYDTFVQDVLSEEEDAATQDLSDDTIADTDMSVETSPDDSAGESTQTSDTTTATTEQAATTSAENLEKIKERNERVREDFQSRENINKKEWSINKLFNSKDPNRAYSNTAPGLKLVIDENTIDERTGKPKGRYEQVKYSLAKQVKISRPDCLIALDHTIYNLSDKANKAFDAVRFFLPQEGTSTIYKNPITYLQRFNYKKVVVKKGTKQVVSNDISTVNDETEVITIPESTILNQPYLRILYNMVDKSKRDSNGRTQQQVLDIQYNETAQKIIDFSLKEFIGLSLYSDVMDWHSMKDHDRISVFGLNDDAISDSDKNLVLDVLKKNGSPASAVANALGKIIATNMGIRENEAGFAKEYEKIVTGLGCAAVDYATAYGIFEKSQFNPNEWNEEHKETGLKHPLKNKINCIRLATTTSGKATIKAFKRQWKGTFDKDNNQIQLGFNEFKRKNAGNERSGILWNKPQRKSIKADKENGIQRFIRNTSGKIEYSNAQYETVDNMIEQSYEVNTPLTDYLDEGNNWERMNRAYGWKSEAEMDLMSYDAKKEAEGKNRSIEATATALQNAAIQQKSYGEDFKGIYFDYFYSKNGRLFIDSSGLNPQTQKLHRFLVPPKNSAVLYDFVGEGSAKLRVLEAFAIAQAFDKLSNKENHLKLLDALDAMSEEELKAMRDKILDGKEAFEKAYENDLKLGIEDVAQALQAVQHLILKKQAKKNGAKAFKTYLLAEIDSTTSGYAIKLSSFPISQKLRNFLEKVGIFSPATKYTSQPIHALKKQKGFLDLYRTTAKGVTELLAELHLSKDNPEADEKLNKKYYNAVKDRIKYLEDTITDANKKKNEAKIKELRGEIKELCRTYRLMEDALPKAVNNVITSELRNLMKPPTMVFGYSAGIKSIAAKVSAEIMNTFISTYMEIAAVGSLEAYLKGKEPDTHAQIKAIYNTMDDIAKRAFVYRKVGEYKLAGSKEYKADLVKMLKNEPYSNITVYTNKGKTGKTSLDKYFNKLIAPTYGNAIGETLSEAFDTFVDLNDRLINVSSTMAKLYIEARQYLMNKAQAEAKNERLTIKQEREIDKQLSGILPYVTLANNTSENDAKMLISNNERVTDYTNRAQSIYTDSNGNVVEGTSAFAENRQLGLPGRAGAVVPIHGLDGVSINDLALEFIGRPNNENIPNQPAYGMTFVHDAIVCSFSVLDEVAEAYNKSLITRCANFDVYSNMLDNFSRIIQEYAKVTGQDLKTVLERPMIDSFNKNVRPTDEEDTYGVRYVVTGIGANGEPLSEPVKTIWGYLDENYTLAEQYLEAKEDWYRNNGVITCANMECVTDEGLFNYNHAADSNGQQEFKEAVDSHLRQTIKQLAKESDSNPEAVMNASPRGYQTNGAISYALTQSLSSAEARANFVDDLQHIAEVEGSLRCSDEHAEHLKKMILKFKPENPAGIIVNLANNGKFNTAFVTASGEITVVNDDRQNVDPITKMAVESTQSSAENYAHEIVHLGTDFGFKHKDVFGFHKEITQLQQIQKEAMDIITWQDFMPDNYDPSLHNLYERHAKELWNYIFNNSAGNLSGLSEFCAYAMTNEKIRKLLSGQYAKSTQQYKAKSLVDKIISIVSGIFDVLFKGGKFNEIFSTTYDVAKGNKPVLQRTLLEDLDRLIYKMYSANVNAANNLQKHPMKLAEGLFSLMGQYINKGNHWLSTKFEDLITYSDRNHSNLYQAIMMPVNASAWDKTKLFAKVLRILPTSRMQRRELRRALTDILGWEQQGARMSLLRDLVEPDKQSSLLELLSLKLKRIDTASKSLEACVENDLTNAFSKPLKKIDRVSMTHSLLYTNAQALYDGTNFDYINGLLSGTVDTNKEIQTLEKELRANYKKVVAAYHISQCVGRARFNITGLGHEMLNLNSHNQANAEFVNNKNFELKPEHRVLVEKLTALYALQNTDADYKLITSTLDKEGVENFLKEHKNFVQESFNGTKITNLDGKEEIISTVENMHVIDGYTKALHDPNIEILKDIATPQRIEELRKGGWKLQAKSTQNSITQTTAPMGIYTRPGFTKRTDGNTFVITGAHSIGSSLRDAAYMFTDNTNTKLNPRDLHAVYMKNAEKMQAKLRKRMLNGQPMTFKDFENYSTGYIPIVGPTGITDYRITMPKEMTRQALNTNEDAITILSKMYASSTRKAYAKIGNEILIKFLKEDVKNNMNSKFRDAEGHKYIELTPKTKNKYLQEMWNVIPRELKDELKKGSFYVREDWLQYLFGVPSWSILEAGWVQKIPSYLFKRALAVAEMIIKAVAYKAKEQIVFRVPLVLIGNIISNFNYSLMTHQNPLKVFKATIANLRAIRSYIDDKKALDRITFKERVGTATPLEIKQKTFYRDKLKSNIVHPLMEKGMYQAIVEDINPSDLENVGKIDQWLEAHESFAKIPNAIRWAGKQLYMSRGTPIFDFMFTLTQYSDFVARATEYQLIMDNVPKAYQQAKAEGRTTLSYDAYRKQAEENASISILNTFINYDKPQSKAEQYMNDMGLLFFTKFAKRIQHVVFRELRQRPIHAIIYLLTQAAIWDTEDILEQNFFNKHWTALFHNPLENLVTATMPIPVQAALGMQRLF